MHTTNIIRAELIDSDICSGADVTARSQTPVLSLCRELLAAGFKPDRALLVFRGSTLALRVRSIGEAARLEIDGHGTGFRPCHKRGRASPVRKSCPDQVQVDRRLAEQRAAP